MLNQNVDLIKNPVLRALKNYENHPSVKGIERNVERRNFYFMFAFFTGIEQQLKNLNPKKASQDTNIPTRILKENSDIFAQFVLKNHNEVQTTSIFPNVLRHGTVRPIYKKGTPETKCKTIAQWVSWVTHLNCMGSFCLMKWQLTLTIFCQIINVDSEKDSALNSV